MVLFKSSGRYLYILTGVKALFNLIEELRQKADGQNTAKGYCFGSQIKVVLIISKMIMAHILCVRKCKTEQNKKELNGYFTPHISVLHLLRVEYLTLQ